MITYLAKTRRYGQFRSTGGVGIVSLIGALGTSAAPPPPPPSTASGSISGANVPYDPDARYSWYEYPEEKKQRARIATIEKKIAGNQKKLKTPERFDVARIAGLIQDLQAQLNQANYEYAKARENYERFSEEREINEMIAAGIFDG